MPTQLRHSMQGEIYEDAMGRIILPMSRERSDQEEDKGIVSEILISDSQGLKFSPSHGPQMRCLVILIFINLLT